MTRQIAAPLLIVLAAVAMASCSTETNGGGGSSGGGEPKKPANQGPSERELLRNTYRTAKQVCGALPPARIARQLGLSKSATEDEIAEEYSEGSAGAHRGFAFDGCYEALLGK